MEILLEASKAIGLEVNREKTKYMIMSRDQNIVRNGNIKIGDLSFEEAEKFKYLGATVTNINYTREEIKRRMNMGNAKIFGAKREEVTGEWRKLHNAELHALCSSPDIIRNIKSRRLRWAGHVAHMGESRNAYRVLVGRPEGKRPLGRPRRRWEDNIKMGLREVGYDDRDWINLAQDRDHWRAYVRTAMNLRTDDSKDRSTDLRHSVVADISCLPTLAVHAGDAAHRAEFVGNMDKAFDSLNGSTVFENRKTVCMAVKEKSTHVSTWNEILNF
ncbi:hypothetical protein ANN_11038 [Periplaneta americana]|uniref:Uncharacterized protein n=1 Tax=Periplaneta americana TaxID=6978 RepID=A0ABQ8T5M3_PERAM|nr:hypothetical protein ANN_11038 [Periplaneta americana]